MIAFVGLTDAIEKLWNTRYHRDCEILNQNIMQNLGNNSAQHDEECTLPCLFKMSKSKIQWKPLSQSIVWACNARNLVIVMLHVVSSYDNRPCYKDVELYDYNMITNGYDIAHQP